jgi:hypothetical protein
MNLHDLTEITLIQQYRCKQTIEKHCSDLLPPKKTTKINDNIRMDGTIAGSMNARS